MKNRAERQEQPTHLLQSFFTDYLVTQRQASPHTIASYRDTFRLLFLYAQKALKKAPSQIALSELDSTFVLSFLDQLERDRKVTARTRNQRLAAIRSFFQHVALYLPDYSGQIQRILAIPNKRYHRRLVGFLSREEVEALLDAPDRTSWSGRRDHALLAVAIQTGMRVSELQEIRIKEVELGSGAHIPCQGKGRKSRCTPLHAQTVKVLRRWVEEQLRHGRPPSSFLFPSQRGIKLSADGVQYIIDKHLPKARKKCPSLQTKRVTPHVLRHTTAMHLLFAGVDPSLIALWLGHENSETVHVYVTADLNLKEALMAKTTPYRTKSSRYRATDQLLKFLDGL